MSELTIQRGNPEFLTHFYTFNWPVLRLLLKIRSSTYKVFDFYYLNCIDGGHANLVPENFSLMNNNYPEYFYSLKWLIIKD